ncbi:hypothetical protein [Sphingomonas qomolangmaensis]|uniref:DUF86 domain-containing protein n=1 Tax=Sphingomonas qomolangmaensis TaxID=2918765 RepID=A0ABY5L734_9SPHN|nr:hypothetical protein [Sphingomonas qomolangmaensis]UUL82602.1 hypothetical protein NMP03_15755 [Sphingomonas qomolangmaensis]
MTPEQEIIFDLLEAARALVKSSSEALDLLGSPPASADNFAAMTTIQRITTTALLKQFEQLEGTLHGLFRAILRALGVRLKGLYPLDIANRMAELDVLDDPPRWVAIVKLRNNLAHDYPPETGDRYERFLEAYASFAYMFDATQRVERVIQERHLLDEEQ